MKDPVARFWSRVRKGDGECWIWQGARSSSGYGTVGVLRLIALGLLPRSTCRVTGVHRVAYMLANGRHLAPDEHIDHLCHDSSLCRLDRQCPHRLCVNPAHLAAVPRAENNRRAGWYDNNTRNGWGERETCGKGHRYDEDDNLRWSMDGKGNRYRRCRACHHEWYLAHRK